MSDERARRLSVVCYQTSMEDILFLTVKGTRGAVLYYQWFSLSINSPEVHCIYFPVVHCVQQKRTLPTI